MGKIDIQKYQAGIAESCWFEADDPSDERFLVTPLYTVIQEKLMEQATKRIQVNGRFRGGQVPESRFEGGLYLRLVFVECCADWDGLTDADGHPLPCTPEYRALIAEISPTRVSFVHTMAQALADMGEERTKAERAAFRSQNALSAGQSGTALRSMLDVSSTGRSADVSLQDVSRGTVSSPRSDEPQDDSVLESAARDPA